MVNLVGMVDTIAPIVNQLFIGKVYFSANVEVPERIKKLYSLASYGISEQLETDGKIEGLPFKVNCVFTKYGEVSFKACDFGNVMGLIVYPMQKWLDNNLSDIAILTCITEELCHYLWAIEDEVEINFKVLDVIKRILPKENIQMSDLYNVQWMEENKK